MIRDAGDRIEVSGPLTLGKAREMLEAGNALIVRPEVTFDLAQVQEVEQLASSLAAALNIEVWLRRGDVRDQPGLADAK